MPLFSVVIPTYNRLNFLKICIESVLSQDFKDFEIIVVDDGSTDKTEEYINSLQKIKYIYQKNQGPAKARNTGIKNSSGEFIAFLDSDDIWTKNKLSTHYYFIKKFPEYKLFHTQEIWYRQDKLLNQKKKHRKPSGYVFDRCLELCCISISTSLIHRQIFDDIGVFDESLPVCEDYDFWLRACLKHPIYLIDKPLTIKKGGHPDQLSKKFYGLDRFRIIALVKLLESNDLIQAKRELVIKELERKCLIYANGCFKRGKVEEGNHYLNILTKYKDERFRSKDKSCIRNKIRCK